MPLDRKYGVVDETGAPLDLGTNWVLRLWLALSLVYAIVAVIYGMNVIFIVLGVIGLIIPAGYLAGFVRGCVRWLKGDRKPEF